jgi:hypothetical protein
MTGSVYSQDAGQRARDLAASLDKTKYKKKEKRNVAIEIYIDIKNEPVVRNAAGYSGLYQSDGHEYNLQLSVSADGVASGSGYDSTNFDNGQKVNFTLKDARVDGALLTGTKAFDNGTSEKFEAVFVNRTVSAGQNPNSISTHDTSYGLGFVQTNGTWTNRVFLDFMR